MSFISEGRTSNSPWIEMIWRGRTDSDCAPICPATGRWHLQFLKQDGKVLVSVEGPKTRAKPKVHAEGDQWVAIRFAPGTFLSSLPMRTLLDGKALLPEATRNTFWLHGSAWQFPDYENVETFVERLVREDLLFRDPVVNAALANQPQGIPLRTVRHRFLQATGLSQGIIRQIERAQQAATFLEQGMSILDVVDQLSYADQAHLTRSLKRFMGQTPAQITRTRKSE